MGHLPRRVETQAPDQRAAVEMAAEISRGDGGTGMAGPKRVLSVTGEPSRTDGADARLLPAPHGLRLPDKLASCTAPDYTYASSRSA